MRAPFALALLFLPCAAQAQLTLVTYDGVVEIPLGSLFNYGKVAAGDTMDIRFRARNAGNAPVVLTTLSVAGAGFSLVNPPATPYTVAPRTFVEFPVRFFANTPASYSANLQVNGASVLLLATAVPVPALTATSGCTGPDPNTHTIDFGLIAESTAGTCTLSLTNSSTTQSLPVGAVAVSGTGFGPLQGLSAPLTLLPGESVPFTIKFTPADAATYSGALVIDTRTFPLTGAAYNPLLTKPALTFDSATIGSAQQPTLRMSLPAGAPFAGSGYLTLVFAPATKVISNDPAVMFVPTGTRILPFSFKQGDTQILLNGQPGAVFQTGTTAGTITFVVAPVGFQFAGDATTVVTIAPQQVSIEAASAVSRVNDLDIVVTGYDNTYTAGAMSFTFYDTTGAAINPGTIQADFTSAFATYFVSQAGGSAFLMRVTFPVTGTTAQSAQVAAVDVTLNNSAGAVHTSRLSFP